MTRSMFWFPGFPRFLILFSCLLTTFFSIAAISSPSWSHLEVQTRSPMQDLIGRIAAISRFGRDPESTTSSTALSWLRSSSSSSGTPKFKYDVFLSFRGDDTRNSFTSHLHKALCDKNISTFIDGKLERGDEISPSLLKAIEESRISVVIFSKDYASSRWCLEELVKIIECRQTYKQIVIPVFYGVEPTHIRHQTGDLADAFADHEQRFKKKVQAWKDVLGQAANFSGWKSDTNKPESALVEKIVEDILKRLKVYRSCHDRNLVGIYSRIKDIVESGPPFFLSFLVVGPSLLNIICFCFFFFLFFFLCI